jgi:hypothetical protein
MSLRFDCSPYFFASVLPDMRVSRRPEVLVEHFAGFCI